MSMDKQQLIGKVKGSNFNLRQCKFQAKTDQKGQRKSVVKETIQQEEIMLINMGKILEHLSS